MIRSFQGKGTRDLFDGNESKAGRRACSPELAGRVRELLDQLDWAVDLRDVREPPSNGLEKLRGDRAGQWSLRINDQFRICFQWIDGHAWNVEVTKHYR